ncbi:MAG: hypothetical protein IKM99_10735 [Bacteroidales bacterium]|nr:hypothetical protein [Bacteroidales bacterium]
MFNKTDKKYLYWIIESYLSDKITGESFCNAFYESYDLEINLCCLSEAEQRIFDELNAVVGRYSRFKEDLHLHPGVYFNDEQLRTAVQKAKDKLPFEFGLEKYAIRFLCSFFNLYSAYISKVEINNEKIKGVICYEYDEQTQEFLWDYPMDKRIKNAIGFLDFVNKHQLNQGEVLKTSKEGLIGLLQNEGWTGDNSIETMDFVLNLNIQMIDEGFVTDRFTIHF